RAHFVGDRLARRIAWQRRCNIHVVRRPSIEAALSGGLRAPGLPTLPSLRLIDLLRKGPANPGSFYASSHAGFSSCIEYRAAWAISMEPLGAGDRRIPRAARR